MGWYDSKKPDRKGTAEGNDIPQLLRDFRHVAASVESTDRTEGQRDAREFKKSSYAKFALQLAAMERDYRNGKEEAEEETEMDIGTAKCVELCEKLLRDIAEKVK